MKALLEFKGGLRALGHPVHVMLVHFPMGLWPLVFPLELAGRLGDWELGWKLAFYTSTAGLLFALPALLTGAFDLLSLRDRPQAASTAILHMLAMLTATGLFGIDLLLRCDPSPESGAGAFVSLGLTLSATLVLLFGGWLGGELVLRHRAGALPADAKEA